MKAVTPLRWVYYPPFNNPVWGAGDEFFFGHVLGADYNSHGDLFVAVNLPDANPQRKSKFTEPYWDSAGLGAMVSVLTPIYYTGMWDGVFYNDTYMASTGLDIVLSQVSNLLVNLDSSITHSNFALIVSDEGRAIVISEPVADRLFNSTGDLQLGTSAEVTGATSIVQATQSKSLFDLTNGDWRGMFDRMLATPKGEAGHTAIDLSLKGAKANQTFLVTYDRWPRRVADYNFLMFTPQSEVRDAVLFSFSPSNFTLSARQPDTVTSNLTMHNQGTIDLVFSITSTPAKWLGISQTSNTTFHLAAGASMHLQFLVWSTALAPGQVSGAIAMEVRNDGYQLCLFNKEVSLPVTFDVTPSDCPAGFEYAALKQQCQACPLNHYKPMVGNGQCDRCPAGATTNSTGATSWYDCVCQAHMHMVNGSCRCAVGFEYEGLDEGRMCSRCPAGKYKDQVGNQLCHPCMTHGTTHQQGGTSRSACLCSEGFFLDQHDQGSCAKCKEGTDCDDEQGLTLHTLVLAHGYWRVNQDSRDIRPCYEADACLGGANSSGYCRQGHKGPFCQVCTDGFYMTSGLLCQRCGSLEQPGAGQVVFMLVLWVFVPLGTLLLLGSLVACSLRVYPLQQLQHVKGLTHRMGTRSFTGRFGLRTSRAMLHRMRSLALSKTEQAVLRWRRMRSRRGLDMTATFRTPAPPNWAKMDMAASVRVVISSWQVLSKLQVVLQLPLPPVFVSLLRGLRVMAGDIVSHIPVSCLYPAYNFHWALLVATAAPMLPVGLFVGLGYLAQTQASHTHPTASVWSTQSVSRMQLWSVGFYRAAILLCFLIYPNVCTMCFWTFLCEDLDDGSRWLRADFSVDCTSSGHLFWQAYAMVMIAVWPIGVPMIFGLLLWRCRSHSLQPDENDGSSQISDGAAAFLMQGYRPERWWFEVFECLRKAMLTGFLVFMWTGKPIQITAAIAISVMGLAGLLEAQPYIHRGNQQLAVGCQLFTIAVLVVGRELQAGELPSDSGALGEVLVTACLLPGTVVVLLIGHMTRRWRLTHMQLEKAKAEQAALQEELRMYTECNTEELDALGEVFSEQEMSPELQNSRLPFAAINLQHRIGTGAFGEVFIAEYHGTPVAVKRLLRHNITSKEHLHAFIDECVLMMQLHHPNILHALGGTWGTADPNVCLVTEFCEMGSLEDVCEESNLTWAKGMTDVAMGVARGMAYLHGQDPTVIHRDLKPGNILFDSSMTAKIGDFGTSRKVELDTTMTMSGTLAYMAPEVILGERYTEKVDIWSFGVVLGYMCLKDHPVEQHTIQRFIHGHNAEEVMRDIVHTNLPASKCPSALKPIIKSCFHDDPASRPSFRDLLLRLVEEGPVIADQHQRFLETAQSLLTAMPAARPNRFSGITPQKSRPNRLSAPPEKGSRLSMAKNFFGRSSTRLSGAQVQGKAGEQADVPKGKTADDSDSDAGGEGSDTLEGGNPEHTDRPNKGQTRVPLERISSTPTQMSNRMNEI